MAQHFSIIKIEEPVLKDSIWHVDVLVSSNDVRVFRLEINAKTGRIMGFSRNQI